MGLRGRLYDKQFLEAIYAISKISQRHHADCGKLSCINLPFLYPQHTYRARSGQCLPSVSGSRKYTSSTKPSRKPVPENESVSPVAKDSAQPHPEARHVKVRAIHEDTSDRPSQGQRDDGLQMHQLLNLDRVPRSPEQKQLMWRAWTGLSDDVQATRLQLLESLLNMLQTEEPSDAYKIRSLLDSKQNLLDKTQRTFYSFWSHAVLQEPDLAMAQFENLPRSIRLDYWEYFMQQTVASGDWAIGVRLWHMILFETQWRGKGCIRDLLRLIPNVHTWQFLRVLKPEDAQEMQDRIRTSVIMHVSRTEDYRYASDLINEVLAIAAHVSEAAVASQMRALSLHGSAAEAMDLYYMVKEVKSDADATPKMSLAAVDAVAQLNNLEAVYKLLQSGIIESLENAYGQVQLIMPYTTLMNALATHGQIDQVDKLLDDYVGKGRRPDIVMLSAVVRARVQMLEVAKAVEMFNRCRSDYGVEPDRVAHNILLHAFSSTFDVQAGETLLAAMLEAGMQPDVYTASTYVDLYAHSKDSEGAEAAFNLMVELGVKPNAQVYGALMHAYMEAEDFERLSKVTTEFAQSDIRPNVGIMNILLKQFMRQERPLSEMQALIKDMTELGIQPDDMTYAQLLRTMLQEHETVEAFELFESLRNPTVYHYTIMMVGLIRERTAASHDALLYYYNAMLDRGIRPTYVTMAVLMNAFVLRGSAASHRKAIKLLDSLESWKDIDLSSDFMPRNIPSPDVYMPLLRPSKSSRSERIDAEDVYNRFLKSIFNTSAKPGIKILTAMMSIYAAAGHTDQVRVLFKAIRKEADRLYRYPPMPESASFRNLDPAAAASLLQTRTAEYEPQVRRGGRFIMSAPVSIFAKHMARQRAYSEIDDILQELGEAGYTFDTGVWNFLTQAKLTQGDISVACRLMRDHLLVGGGRIYERTAYQFRKILDRLERGQLPSRIRKPVEENGDRLENKNKAKHIWQDIKDNHGRVVSAVDEVISSSIASDEEHSVASQG